MNAIEVVRGRRSVAGDIRIREIEPGDQPALERFYAELSPEARHLRFFGGVQGLTHTESAAYCSPDHHHRQGFVAERDVAAPAEPRIVGHLCIEPDGSVAEVAIAVADDFRCRGLGHRLMEAGLAWAIRERITRLTATTLTANSAIHRLLLGLGLSAHVRTIDSGEDEITIDLGERATAA